MADETVRIIRIETGGSEQTVKGLKDEINSLRDALLNTEKGTEEYKQVLEQLIADQQKLAEVMNAGKSQVSAATGSYNALVNQMTALKKVWRETTDEASRKELGNQIKDINEKLSKMDESIGDYRRNVGNYANAISASFSQMGGAAKGMVGPLSSVKAGLTAISSHPIVAVLTVLAGLLINGIAKGFKSSEENTNKLRVAFSGFKAIGDAVTNMFQTLAGWMAKVAEAAINFADKLGLITPKMKERMELTKKQISIEKQERDLIIKNAQLETEAAELRAKASDEENYTISQRIKFLQEAQAKEEEQLQLEKEILEQKVAQLEAQLALTDSTGEELTKLNELKAQVIKVNAQIAQSQRSTNREITSLRRRALSEQQQANQARLNLEKELIQQEYELAEDGSEDQLSLAKELRDKELEIQKETLKQKIKNRSDYEKAMKLAIQAYNTDIMKLETEYQRKSAEKQIDEYYDILLRGVREGSKEEYALRGARANEMIANAVKGTEETEHKFKERLEGYRREAAKYFDMGIQAAEQETKIINQIILNGTRPMSKYYFTQYDQLKKYYDSMEKLNSESNEEFAARQDAAWKAALDALANAHGAYIDESNKFWEVQRANNYTGYQDLMDDMMASETKNLLQFKATLNSIAAYVVLDVDAITKATGKGKVEIAKMIDSLDLNNMDNLNSAGLSKLLNENAEEFKNFMYELAHKSLIPDELVNAYVEGLKGLADAEKDILDYRYNNWNDLAKGIADLMGGISDIYTIKLENEKKTLEKEGKYTEQERKNLEERYKTVQAMQIAEATINTISGAIAAFMKCQELGQPWGAILGAVQAAAVTAAGVAQIMKIKQTNPYSDSSSSLSSSGMMTATVTPTVSDFNPEYTTNLSGRSDTEYLNEVFGKTKLFVSVVDINDAQERGRVRVAESSF